MLKNNGGSTDTVALLAGSMAINAGNDAVAPKFDQRGYLRAGAADIGAFEAGGLPLRITSIVRLTNGHIVLQGIGVPGASHTIQASATPAAGGFGFLNSSTANGAGLLQYEDAPPTGLRARFYRFTYP